MLKVMKKRPRSLMNLSSSPSTSMVSVDLLDAHQMYHPLSGLLTKETLRAKARSCSDTTTGSRLPPVVAVHFTQTFACSLIIIFLKSHCGHDD